MLVAGGADVALVVGFDKHPPGAFNPLPEEWGIGSWYGETGLMLTTQFFAMKIQRYMAEHGISESTLAKVATKAFENGSLNPNAWRRKPLSEDEVLGSKMVNHPLTQYMFCSPGEGAVALVLARAEQARASSRASRCYLRSVAFRTRRFGSFEVFSPSIPVTAAPSPTAEAAAAAFEQAGIGPEDVDVAQLQDTESGAEVMHLAETGLCAARRAGGADPARRDAHRRAPAGQHRRRLPGQRGADRRLRACARSTRSCCSCAATAGDRQVPGRRRSASRRSTARPASAPAPSSRSDGHRPGRPVHVSRVLRAECAPPRGRVAHRRTAAGAPAADAVRTRPASSSRRNSVQRSAIMITVMFGGTAGIVGMIDASTTCRPSSAVHLAALVDHRPVRAGLPHRAGAQHVRVGRRRGQDGVGDRLVAGGVGPGPQLLADVGGERLLGEDPLAGA